MSSSLTITVSTQQGKEDIVILSLKGELDGSTFKELQAKTEEIISGDVNNILLDMSALSYIGSAGLRAIHSASNSSKEKGGSVKLLNPSDASERVLKTLGFDQFFEIYKDLDKAIDSFKKPH
jgi:anti-anti-sigma factor